jgi:hypothetical protein
MAFLNGQKVASGTLPFRAMIPTEEWVLLLDFNDSSLHGYVSVSISSCTQR